MKDFHLVQFYQTFGDLDKDVPNVFLIELSSFFLMLEYLLQQIASIGILHDNTKY